jgi:hypothetical protein
MPRRAAALALVLSALPAVAAPPAGPALPDAAALRRLEAQYAPVDLAVDLSTVAPRERTALARLVEAGRIMDALFLRQVWAGNEALLLGLLDQPGPLGAAQLAYFLRNKGPWDRLDGNRPFLPGVPGKPPGAGFYPAGASKEDVERLLAGLPPA